MARRRSSSLWRISAGPQEGSWPRRKLPQGGDCRSIKTTVVETTTVKPTKLETTIVEIATVETTVVETTGVETTTVETMMVQCQRVPRTPQRAAGADYNGAAAWLAANPKGKRASPGVFWDLYCAAPERRDTCEHSSEAKAFHDYSAAAAPSPVLGNIPPNDGMPGGPIPPGFFQPFMSPRYAGGPRPPIRMGNQPPGAVPGTQPLLPNSMDPTRQQGHPNMGGPMQRMNPPRGMGPMGPGPQNYGSGMRPPPNSLGPGMPGINMGPGAGRPWPNPSSANSIPYSSSSPGTYVGPPGGGGPPGTPIMPSPADSTNSSDNIYTMINPVPPAGSRSNFPMGPGSDGPMGGMGGMEPHHMNGSLGSGDIDGLPKNSPNNISGISNPPGTPRDDGELGGNFLHSFQNDNYSPSMTMSV
ncbi:PREDICTED: single-stranded DNA-binding protein 3 [Aptenodytes forsteri]|uniref:single-stranded DNA-binding protein 3 n=1 Tax=Aptenodytes forsteri TaxID=9233 RepID=UPI0004F4B949|nr:PREDICTED: single-stranded DNA-binding protein 3 [Aptenodytes forsteri]